MNRGDLKLYMIYLITKNWRWLKFIVLGLLIFMSLKIFNAF